MNEELDQAAEWLEAVTGDPMARAVAGRVRVLAASEPTGRARYQECTLDLEVTASGIDTHTVTVAAVFPRKIWPRVGDELPAFVSTTDPNAIEVDWQGLTRRR